MSERTGVFPCFHCGEQAVIWDADAELAEYGYQGKGIIHAMHYTSCGAEITYVIREDE